jgi:post-segregation antitoxin (ccd killing protein)
MGGTSVQVDALRHDTIVSLALTAPLKAQLREAVRDRGTSMSLIARTALERELAQREERQ